VKNHLCKCFSRISFPPSPVCIIVFVYIYIYTYITHTLNEMKPTTASTEFVARGLIFTALFSIYRARLAAAAAAVAALRFDHAPRLTVRNPSPRETRSFAVVRAHMFWERKTNVRDHFLRGFVFVSISFPSHRVRFTTDLAVCLGRGFHDILFPPVSNRREIDLTRRRYLSYTHTHTRTK